METFETTSLSERLPLNQAIISLFEKNQNGFCACGMQKNSNLLHSPYFSYSVLKVTRQKNQQSFELRRNLNHTPLYS